MGCCMQATCSLCRKSWRVGWGVQCYSPPWLRRMSCSTAKKKYWTLRVSWPCSIHSHSSTPLDMPPLFPTATNNWSFAYYHPIIYYTLCIIMFFLSFRQLMVLLWSFLYCLSSSLCVFAHGLKSTNWSPWSTSSLGPVMPRSLLSYRWWNCWPVLLVIFHLSCEVHWLVFTSQIRLGHLPKLAMTATDQMTADSKKPWLRLRLIMTDQNCNWSWPDQSFYSKYNSLQNEP